MGVLLLFMETCVDFLGFLKINSILAMVLKNVFSYL